MSLPKALLAGPICASGFINKDRLRSCSSGTARAFRRQKLHNIPQPMGDLETHI